MEFETNGNLLEDTIEVLKRVIKEYSEDWGIDLNLSPDKGLYSWDVSEEANANET